MSDPGPSCFFYLVRRMNYHVIFCVCFQSEEDKQLQEELNMLVERLTVSAQNHISLRMINRYLYMYLIKQCPTSMVKGQILYFLVNAASPKPLDRATSNFAGSIM